MSPISVGDDKEPLVPPDENANEPKSQGKSPLQEEVVAKREPEVAESLTKPQNSSHATLKPALSLPTPQSNGDLVKPPGEAKDDWLQELQEGRSRSRSEILSGESRPHASDVSLALPLRKPLDKEQSSSAQSLVGKALQDEGLRLTEDDPLVRVAEQEIKEAFDVSTDELNEAAEKLLSELEDNLNQNSDMEPVNEATEECFDEDEITSSPWKAGLRSIPESSIVITDL